MAIEANTGLGPIAVIIAELRLWRTIALVALALWAVNLAVWIIWILVQRRRRARPASALMAADSTPARHAFTDAGKREDWPAAARALLAWARQTRPDLRNLGELRQAVSDTGQAVAIADLERACYGTDNSGRLTAADLARCFARWPSFGKRDPEAGGDQA